MKFIVLSFVLNFLITVGAWSAAGEENPARQSPVVRAAEVNLMEQADEREAASRKEADDFVRKCNGVDALLARRGTPCEGQYCSGRVVQPSLHPVELELLGLTPRKWWQKLLKKRPPLLQRAPLA